METNTDALIRYGSLLGLPSITAENSRLSATIVPGLGSRVMALRCKQTGIELLRTPDSLDAYRESPMLYGIPVLFPPNRIKHGRFSFEGVDYQFDQNDAGGNNHSHGLVHDQPWESGLCTAEGNKALLTTRFDSRQSPSVGRQFPHDFTIVMRITLDGSLFIQEAEIRNESKAPFPWGLGYHTTFRFPFSGDSSADSGLALQAPAGQRWALDDELLPTGERVFDERSSKLRAGMPLRGVRLDDVFAASDKMRNEAILSDPCVNLRVIYSADPAFGQWVLHNGDGHSGYLCPEPYTCVTNAFNLALNRELTGMQVLQPGEAAVVSCSIEARKGFS
jgi:aldose 1-epimerase